MTILIDDIKARQIIDSRANPALEVEVKLNNGIKAVSQVPSGASKGKFEALELRDNNPDYLFSKSVLKAVENVDDKIAPQLRGLSPYLQYDIDSLLFELDGSDNFSSLGANAALGVSFAVMEAAASSLDIELFQYIGGINARTLPVPLINIVNGGVHSDNNLDFQEFMIVPLGAQSFSHAMQISLEVFHSLKEILKKKGLSITVGDEGGFSPSLSNPKIVLELILDAIFEAGHSTDTVKLALDVASSEFYKDGKYNLKGQERVLSTCEMVDYLSLLVDEYPIISIEDGLAEDDFDGWKLLTEKMSKKCMLVGDDLFVTNPLLLKKGIEENIANSILIKPNQIATVTKTLECVDLAKRAGYKTILSHRSGETESTIIADFAVGLNSGFIKTGSMSRVDRTAKYNRLLRIEEFLGNSARYLGFDAIKY